MKIAMWGLAGAGKSVMLLGLIRALAKYGEDLGWEHSVASTGSGGSSSYLRYTMARFLENNSLPPPTLALTQLQIGLKCRGNYTGRNYRHSLTVVDPPGEYVVGSRNDEAYFEHVSEAEAIVCMLNNQYTGLTHLEGIPKLQKYLQTSGGKRAPHYVAICLAKCDRHYSHHEIRKLYASSDERQRRDYIVGVVGQEVLRTIEQLFDPSRIRYFLTSAIGWTKARKGGFFPNMTAVNGTASYVIYNPLVWRPYDVLEPFFWLVDEVELFEKDRWIQDIRYEQHIADFWAWQSIVKEIPDYGLSFAHWQENVRRK